jgi:hypothetical protein
MTTFPEKIPSALMDSILAAFRTEALTRSGEVDAAGQDVEKIRAASSQSICAGWRLRSDQAPSGR